MNQSERAELRRRAEAATKGPWEADGTVIVSRAEWPMDVGPDWHDWDYGDGLSGRYVAESRTKETPEDAQLIAAANPVVILSLLSDIDGLETEMAALKEALEAAEDERDEAVNWTEIVERHGTDGFDDLAEAWLAMEPIQRMHNAVSSVFAKWANDDLMSRFKQHMSAILQVAFVEGCLVGIRAERAALSTPPEHGEPK